MTEAASTVRAGIPATTTLGSPLSEDASPRERILHTAYELFSRHGLQAVGINSVVEHSGVAKRTLYRHFASKDDLIVEFLSLRELRWSKEWLEQEVGARATTPEDRLLAIFDVFHDWFQRDDMEGCSFISVLLEVPNKASPVHEATVEHLANIRAFLAGLATEAGISRPEDFARRWHILMKGSIVAAQEGDLSAARHAQDIARLLLERERAGLLE